MGHLPIHPRVVALRRTKLRTFFDDGMYIIALVSPAMTIPQLLVVWTTHRVSGLSIFSWTAYTVGSGIWLIYGLVQKQKPIIISSVGLFVIDFGVVLGVCLFR